MTTKTCSRCGHTKPREEFRQRKANRDGLEGTCIACQAERSEAWRKANPERAREIGRRSRAKHREKVRDTTRRLRIRREYGLTVEEYDRIVAKGCAICGAAYTPGPGGTALDLETHDAARAA